MSVPRRLLAEFLREYPFQPATAFWRAIEIGEVARAGFPEGFGLDLGCGDGKLTRILLDLVGSRSLVGVDVDPAETRAAKTQGFYQRVHAVSGSAIPEDGGSFDFVFSNSVLEHVEDIGGVLGEVGRVLRPGGVFLFTVPASGFRDLLAGPLLRLESRERYLAALDARLAHRRYWTRDEWRGQLAGRGMQVERTAAYMTVDEVRRWENLARWTAGVLYGAFAAIGRRRRPIEIQRTLGLRRSGARLPAVLAGMLSRGFAWGMPERETVPASAGACEMYCARKQR